MPNSILPLADGMHSRTNCHQLSTYQTHDPDAIGALLYNGYTDMRRIILRFYPWVETEKEIGMSLSSNKSFTRVLCTQSNTDNQRLRFRIDENLTIGARTYDIV